MRKLTKSERTEVHDRFGGKCAYCGDTLGKGWCVDHREPILRGHTDKDLLTYGVERGAHEKENWVPACRRCNLRKSSMSLELFRCEIRAQAARLLRDSTSFKLAVDFGVVKINPAPRVRFYFEEVENVRA